MLSNLLIFAAGIVIGILIWAMAKQDKQKRRFSIENQMLRDQTEILELQKKVSLLENEKQALKHQLSEAQKMGTPLA